MRRITNEMIAKFKEYLACEEKCENTTKKYIRDTIFFAGWLCGREVTKVLILEYKKELCEKYAPASVNGAVSSLNVFFRIYGVARYTYKVAENPKAYIFKQIQRTYKIGIRTAVNDSQKSKE